MGKTNGTAEFFKTSVLAEKIRLQLSIVIEEDTRNAAELSAILEEGKYTVKKRICRLYAGKQCLGEGRISEKDGKTVFSLITDKQNAKGGAK
jgi:hypothetical protein